jgi:integrase
MAKNNPEKYERTYFIMTLLYGMYLRISELVETPRWQPKMNDFYRDQDDLWWFKTVGKGNKLREISVSDAVITALKRWRKFLGLSLLPTPADTSPLLPKEKGTAGLSDKRHVRSIVQECFDLTMERLKKDGFIEEAEEMQSATVHWLRHTGISDDVKIRPREHVRDDAGHSSGAITDRYINIERRERHSTAQKKPLKQN